MNWNVNSESTTVPPLYAKSQSSLLQQPLINPLAPASQSSLNFPGSKQEACMYPCNPGPISQPLLTIKNYAIPHQNSVSVMHNGTGVPLQASVERKPYPNGQGPKQLNHSLPMSSGVTQNKWLNSTVRNPVLSHTRTTVVSNHIGFGANTSNTHVLQNQFVTSDSYAMQLQMIPSNPTQGPVMSQGNQGLNQSYQERQIDWAQQHPSTGLTYPDSRSLPKQYYYSQQSFLQDPTLQRQNPMLSKLLDVKNSSRPHHALFSHSQQNASVQSPPYAVPQSDNIPPPPPYECRYANQPSQSTLHVSKNTSVEIPLNQKAHITEIMKELCRGIQQPCQNRDKEVNYKVIGKVGTNESFYNSAVNQPVNNKPVRSVDGVQILAQDTQGKTVDSCNSTSNQLQDANVTKEGLVSDIQKLVEMKKKFFELARKIKINKKLLMAAGCSKATNASLRESAQNSELSSKHTSKIHSGLQITPINSEISEGHSATVMRCTEETSTWNPNIQEVNCRKFTQDNSNSPNSNCSQKVLRIDQAHDFQASLKTAAVEITQTLNNNTQLSSENVRNYQNLPTNSKTITAPQSVFFQELVSEPPNKNTLLQLLTLKDQAKDDTDKNGSEITQDPKSNNFRINQNTQFTNEPTNLKTMETQSAPHIMATVTDESFCLDRRSSANEMSCKSEEVLKTCLSLWKKQPSDPTEKQCNELRTNGTVADVSKPIEVYDKIPCIIVGNSNRKLHNSEQEATLPVVVQNYESTGTNITKGSELQIAVVSPLILSDVRTLSAKEMTPVAVTETAYPVIEEGSVCSLQNHLMENMSVSAALKAHDNELVSNTTLSITISPVIQKEKHDKSTTSSSGQIPNDNQRMPIKSKVEVHIVPNEGISPDVSAQPAMDEPKDSIGVNDVLQIANICSLVEGDVSYNSHIAKMFNSPCLDKVEPQKSCLSDQAMSCRQENEELNKTENKNFELQKEIVKDTKVSLKINDQPEPLPSSEPSYTEAKTEILEESKMECIIEKENITSVTYCSTVIQQSGLESDTPCTSQGALSSETPSEKTADLYLHDQLSELLKEFPYGIDVLSSQKGSVVPKIMEKESKDQSCHKPDCDSRLSTDEIKITVISSEQMKEIFPEQDNHLSDRDGLTEPEMEKPITKVERKCDTKTGVEGKKNPTSVTSNTQKDDIHCCALGWLAQIYEGVPQCQCNSNKNVVSEDEKNQRSPLKSNSYKQERISDRSTPVVECVSFPKKDLETSLPDKKNHSEIKQDRNTKDQYKTKHKNLLKTQEELPSQFPSQGKEKLDSLSSHKRKRKLVFHDVTFHSSSKLMKCEQDSQEKKHMTQNICPPKPKPVILANKSKIQSISPEKRKLKFKVGSSKYKLLENRKSDLGKTFDMERKKKYDKHEQNKNAGNSLKLSNSLSTERTSVKEKTGSIVEKSTNLEINSHRSLVKSSSSHISKSLDSKDNSHKTSNKVLSPKDYFQKHKESIIKASKKSFVIDKMKSVPCDSEHTRPAKHSMQVENCGKSSERNSSVQTSKELSNTSTGRDKTLKIYHPEDSKIHKSSKSVKGNGGEKQPEKMCMDKTKSDKHLSSLNNGSPCIQVDPQAEDQRKLYLNRVGFKCTERESICLSKLDSSSRKSNDTQKSQENKPKNSIFVKDTTEKSMLKFKLCPDVLFDNTDSEWKQKPIPKKEQAPIQVSGIKSTKEAWLKCVNTEKRMREASHQKIDNNILPKSKLPKRSLSAEGLETSQNPVKDSKTMFQTYKKIYMEKQKPYNSL